MTFSTKAAAAAGKILQKAAKGSAKMDSSSDSLVGRTINGKYEVLAELGRGGMGVVYKVRHLILEDRNLFALKVLHGQFSGDETFRKRFMREVVTVMDLTHENIVQIRDFGLTESGLLFFTMDFFEGQPLSDLIKQHSPMGTQIVTDVACQLLLALHEADKGGVVHRDLKPDNILVSDDQIRVLDFGIAKVVEGEAQSVTLTQGNVIGTPKYMSPEQASGEGVDRRSDLYSLGVVLYEMLAGRPPFEGTARTVLLAHLTNPVPKFAEVLSDVEVDPNLEAFVMSLLEKDRESRPASAEACLRSLGMGVTSLFSDEGLQVPATAKSSGLGPGKIAAGLLVAASVAGGVMFLPSSTKEGSAEESQPDLNAATTSQSATTENVAAQSSDAAVEPKKARSTDRYECLLCGKNYRHKEKAYNRCCGERMMNVTASSSPKQ